MKEQHKAKLRKKFEKLFSERYPGIHLLRHNDFPDEYEEMQADICWEGFLMMAESLKPMKFKKDTFGKPYEWGGSFIDVVTIPEVQRWVKANTPFLLADSAGGGE